MGIIERAKILEKNMTFKQRDICHPNFNETSSKGINGIYLKLFLLLNQK